MIQHLGGYILRIVAIELTLVVHPQIEGSMRQQQGAVVTLAGKHGLGRIAYMPDTLLVQIFRDVHQRIEQVVYKALLGHDGRIVRQQLFEGLVVAQLQLQLPDLTVLLYRRKVYLTVISQRFVFLTLLLKTLRESDVPIQFRCNVHHSTPFTVNLFTIIATDRLAHLMLLAFVSGCQ